MSSRLWARVSARLGRAALGAVTGLVVAGSPALAVDGVLEINHTCAVQTGCFPGDAAGYPVTIDGSAGSSYRLTSSLMVPDENTTAVLVSAPRTTIDLGGFEIARSGCAGATSDCTPPLGSGYGIDVSPVGLSGVAVSHGSVTGMGAGGVRVGPSAVASELRVRWNAGNGFDAGDYATLSSVVAQDNGGIGIYALSGSTVSGSTASDNGSFGFYVGSGSVVVDSSAARNSGTGIGASNAVIVSRNTAFANVGDGILAGPGSTISDNSAYSNSGVGIRGYSGSTVDRNAVRSNTGYGLSLSSNAVYRSNVITSNVAGTVLGGVNMGSNSCNGTTTCP